MLTPEISDPVYPRTSLCNYKIFQEHQLNSMTFTVFSGAVTNSGKFQGVQEVGGIAQW